MKLFLFKYILLLFFFLVSGKTVIFAQNYPDSLLCKTWKIDWLDTYQNMSSSKQAKFLSLSENQRNRIQQGISSQVYIFGADFSLRLSWQNQASQAMTWRRTASGITMVYNGLEKSMQIKELTSTDLVLISEDTQVLFTEIHLKTQP